MFHRLRLRQGYGGRSPHFNEGASVAQPASDKGFGERGSGVLMFCFKAKEFSPAMKNRIIKHVH